MLESMAADIASKAVQQAVAAMQKAHQPPPAPTVKSTLTASEGFALWMPHAQITMRPESYRLTKTHWSYLGPALGGLQCMAIGVPELEAFVVSQLGRKTFRKMPPTHTYIARQLRTLHSMFNWLVTQGHIPANPIQGYAKKGSSKLFAPGRMRKTRKTFLSEDQFKEFASHGPPIFQDIATLIYRCMGMRNSEARLLPKEEVSLENMLITLSHERTKTGQSREIPIPDDPEVIDILKRNMAASRGPYVFVSPSDPKRAKPIPMPTIQSWMRKARDKSGLVGPGGENVCLHSLRHSAVTSALEDGAPPSLVGEAAGMSERIMRGYTRWGKSQQATLREFMSRRGPKLAPVVPLPRRRKTDAP